MCQDDMQGYPCGSQFLSSAVQAQRAERVWCQCGFLYAKKRRMHGEHQRQHQEGGLLIHLESKNGEIATTLYNERKLGISMP